MFVVAIVSASGGVGRTTLAANLAAIACKRRRPVLVVEWDPLNRLGLHLGIGGFPEQGWVSETIRGGAWYEAACRNSDGVDFLPFGRVHRTELAAFERRLEQDRFWLDRQLKTIDLPGETLVLIDVAAGFSVYGWQALAAADGVLAVVTPSPGVPLDIEALEEAWLALPKRRPPLKYILNHMDSTRPLSADIAAVLRSQLNSQLLRYPLHQDEAVPEALASNLSVAEYAPGSQANHDLQGIASWLLEASVSPAGIA